MNQWQINDSNYDQLEVQFKTSNSYQKHIDWGLFGSLVKGVMYNKSDLDDMFSKYLPAKISDVNPVEGANDNIAFILFGFIIITFLFHIQLLTISLPLL